MSSKQIVFRVANMDCESEAAAIERGFRGFPGILGLKTYPKSAKVAVSFNEDTTSADALKEKLEALGFPEQEGRGMVARPSKPAPWRNPKVVTSAVSGILLLIGFLLTFASTPAVVSTIIYIAAILVGGYYFGREALEELVFERGWVLSY